VPERGHRNREVVMQRASMRWVWAWVGLTLGAAGAAGHGRSTTADDASATPEPAVAEESAASAPGDEAVSIEAEAETAAESGAATAASDASEDAPTPPPTEEPESDKASTADAPSAPPAAEATPSRVRLKLDVQGELFATAGRNAPAVRRPITVDARFDFIESRPVEPGESTLERRYLDATAELRIDGEPRRTALAGDARTVKVALRGTTPAPHLDGGFLSRDERDLLETPFDPILLERLLPAEPVKGDGTWEIAADVVAGLLAIDTVESGGITARVGEVTDGVATVTLGGIVDGAADGVPTHVTVDGSFTAPALAVEPAGFVSLTDPVASLAVTLRERREASHVAPGFDVEARLTIARSLVALGSGQEPVPATSAAAPDRRRGPGRPGLVWHRDGAGRYDLVHDERWRVIEDGADGLVMRLIDSGALVAQCAITPLPRGAAVSAPSIAEVERDIERSLAGQFGRIEHASEAARSDGVRIVRVATSGRADGLPFRWIHHVLTDAAGHRLAVTCMLEASMEKRFANADRELVDGIGLPGGRAADDQPAAGDREARLPQESRMP
jgi:hypothetical protein